MYVVKKLFQSLKLEQVFNYNLRVLCRLFLYNLQSNVTTLMITTMDECQMMQ